MGGGIVFGALVPHPPVLVPEVGGEAAGRLRDTAAAMDRLGRQVVDRSVTTLAVITPHGPVRDDAACLYQDDRLEGDFAAFRTPGVSLRVAADPDLAAALVAEADLAGLPLPPVQPGRLDHGSLVPLYFLRRADALRPAVILTPPRQPPLAYRYGLLLARAARRAGRRVGILASGDLSHRLTPDAPAGYAPEGAEFDSRLVALLRAGDAAGILRLPPGLAEKAGQDVLPSLAMLLGAMRRLTTEVALLCYEAPFGVGYAVAAWRVAGTREESAPVRAARRALELYFREGWDDPRELARRMAAEEQAPAGGDEPATAGTDRRVLTGEARGVFVSLKRGGELRGCTGTVSPAYGTLLEEIAHNAVASATRDPRLTPVEPAELDELDISVDILEPPEPARSLADLDPRRYGIIVSKGRRRALLLPDLPEVATPERQYELACRKAGLDPGEDGISLRRFLTRRYT